MNADQWRKSTRSSNQASCVELRVAAAATGIRDTKSRESGSLTIPAGGFAAFLTAAKRMGVDAE